MAKWEWAALWKRAAKYNRKKARQFFKAWNRTSAGFNEWRNKAHLISHRRQLWKRAAKKHRRQHKLYKAAWERQKQSIRELVDLIEELKAELEEAKDGVFQDG